MVVVITKIRNSPLPSLLKNSGPSTVRVFILEDVFNQKPDHYRHHQCR